MIRSDNALTNVHIGGACLLCRSPNDIVDTEVSIPYEGVLAICVKCVRDMAICAGYDLEHGTKEWEQIIAEKEESDYIADSLLEVLDAVGTTAKGLTKKHANRLRNFKTRTAARAQRPKSDD